MKLFDLKLISVSVLCVMLLCSARAEGWDQQAHEAGFRLIWSTVALSEKSTDGHFEQFAEQSGRSFEEIFRMPVGTGIAFQRAARSIRAKDAPLEVAKFLAGVPFSDVEQMITIWRESSELCSRDCDLFYASILQHVKNSPVPHEPQPNMSQDFPSLPLHVIAEGSDLSKKHDLGIWFREFYKHENLIWDDDGINVINIRYYDRLLKNRINPRVRVNEYNGRMFVIYKNRELRYDVKSWEWGTSGPGATKQNSIENGVRTLLRNSKIISKSTAERQPDLTTKTWAKQQLQSYQSGKMTNHEMTLMLNDLLAAARDYNAQSEKLLLQAKYASDDYANSSPLSDNPESSKTKRIAEGAIALAHKAIQSAVSYKYLNDKQKLSGINTSRASRIIDQAQKVITQSGNVWALAHKQRFAWEQMQALSKFSKIFAQSDLTQTSRELAKAASEYWRVADRNHYSRLSEKEGVAWASEFQYYAILQQEKHRGMDSWWVNVSPNGDHYTLAARDINGDKVISEGERELPGVRHGVAILIHLGGDVAKEHEPHHFSVGDTAALRFSIGCHVAPEKSYLEFIGVFQEKFGLRSKHDRWRFRYALLESSRITKSFGPNFLSSHEQVDNNEQTEGHQVSFIMPDGSLREIRPIPSPRFLEQTESRSDLYLIGSSVKADHYIATFDPDGTLWLSFHGKNVREWKHPEMSICSVYLNHSYQSVSRNAASQCAGLFKNKQDALNQGITISLTPTLQRSMENWMSLYHPEALRIDRSSNENLPLPLHLND